MYGVYLTHFDEVFLPQLPAKAGLGRGPVRTRLHFPPERDWFHRADTLAENRLACVLGPGIIYSVSLLSHNKNGLERVICSIPCLGVPSSPVG